MTRERKTERIRPAISVSYNSIITSDRPIKEFKQTPRSTNQEPWLYLFMGVMWQVIEKVQDYTKHYEDWTSTTIRGLPWKESYLISKRMKGWTFIFD